ncbi:MAG: hypothetical protein R2769_03835 [Saprospiraceae bacterium]
MPNPLFDILTFNGWLLIKSREMDQIIAGLKAKPEVRDAYYQEGMADLIAGNLKRIGWFSWA